MPGLIDGRGARDIAFDVLVALFNGFKSLFCRACYADSRARLSARRSRSRHLALLTASMLTLGACAQQEKTIEARSAAISDQAHGEEEPRPFDALRNASADVDAALSLARIRNVPAAIILGGNWCHDSRGLAAHLSRPELRQIVAQGFEVVYVDVGYRDRNLHVPRRFGIDEVLGTPTVLIVSPAGVLLNRDSVHAWRTAASKPYAETLRYFQSYAGQAQPD